jgi:hypothetical protein
MTQSIIALNIEKMFNLTITLYHSLYYFVNNILKKQFKIFENLQITAVSTSDFFMYDFCLYFISIALKNFKK